GAPTRYGVVEALPRTAPRNERTVILRSKYKSVDNREPFIRRERCAHRMRVPRPLICTCRIRLCESRTVLEYQLDVSGVRVGMGYNRVPHRLPACLRSRSAACIEFRSRAGDEGNYRNFASRWIDVLRRPAEVV